MVVDFGTESVEGARQDTPPCRLQPVSKKTRLPNYTVGDPRVDQPQMKKNLSFLQEARLPTIPWGPVGDQLDAANQVWQGPYWAVRTQNHIPSSSSLSFSFDS